MSVSGDRRYEEEEEEEEDDAYGETEGIRSSSGEISSTSDESNMPPREMQITSSPYGDSGICVLALTGAGGAESVEFDVKSS